MTTIIVNGRERRVSGGSVSFEDVLVMAAEDGEPDVLAPIEVLNMPGVLRRGRIGEGERAGIEEGTSFVVAMEVG